MTNIPIKRPGVDSPEHIRLQVWWAGFIRGLPAEYQELIAAEQTVPLTREIYDAAVASAERNVLIAGLDAPPPAPTS